MPNTRFEIAPLVEGKWIWRAERYRETDERGALVIDGVVQGLTYQLRDVRFDNMRSFSREERESWVDTKIVLLPGSGGNLEDLN